MTSKLLPYEKMDSLECGDMIETYFDHKVLIISPSESDSNYLPESYSKRCWYNVYVINANLYTKLHLYYFSNIEKAVKGVNPYIVYGIINNYDTDLSHSFNDEYQRVRII